MHERLMLVLGQAGTRPLSPCTRCPHHHHLSATKSLEKNSDNENGTKSRKGRPAGHRPPRLSLIRDPGRGWGSSRLCAISGRLHDGIRAQNLVDTTCTMPILAERYVRLLQAGARARWMRVLWRIVSGTIHVFRACNADALAAKAAIVRNI